MKKILFIAMTIGVTIMPFTGYAAEIFFGVHKREVNLNEKVEVGVFVNTQGASVNAIEGTIVFPSDTLAFKEVRNGGSVITLWIKQPSVSSTGTVTFSGVLPGGFLGNKGYLFSLVFQATKKGNAAISAAGEQILLNDGTGTKAPITKAPLVLQVGGKNTSLQTFIPVDDTTPPEAFQLYVAKDSDIFSDQWFVSFAAQDKESGIDHYEILEKPQPFSIFSFFFREQWIQAESPFVLKDQTLKSVLVVKAFDRKGNITIATLPAATRLSWYENFWFGFIIIITLAVVLILSVKKILWNKIHTPYS